MAELVGAEVAPDGLDEARRLAGDARRPDDHAPAAIVEQGAPAVRDVDDARPITCDRRDQLDRVARVGAARRGDVDEHEHRVRRPVRRDLGGGAETAVIVVERRVAERGERIARAERVIDVGAAKHDVAALVPQREQAATAGRCAEIGVRDIAPSIDHADQRRS
ncbi:MAG: hypothetical protein KIT31_23845 [Deltaproteobacteria bacterium]|nr:hypothetical protein [Deltaproteobacteria bacterium]